MTTVTINLRDDIARDVEVAARREHKSISEWVEEGVAQLGSRPSQPTANGTPANGYSAEWLALFGTLANEDSFAAPARSVSRPVRDINLD